MWSASRKANRILTVSEASKRDILRFFDVKPEKVVVIHNAIDERFLSPANPERMDLVRQRYQLDHPFVLYVGNIKPHKNIDRLIDFGRAAAVQELAAHHQRPDLEAPRPAPCRAPAQAAQTSASSATSPTRRWRCCAAPVFVFPSLRNFGLPPLEAMASGTRSSRPTSSMPGDGKRRRARGPLRCRLDRGRRRASSPIRRSPPGTVARVAAGRASSRGRGRWRDERALRSRGGRGTLRHP